MYNKLNKKLVLKIIIVLFIIEIICVTTIELMKKRQKVSEEKILEIEREENKYTYAYFDNAINNLFEYISEENADAVLSLLDKEFVEEKKLNKENILEYFEEYKEIKGYVSKEVYTQKVAYAQIYKGEYNYIKGTIDKDGDEENIFLLMKQDYINSTFNISIITEQTFEKLSKSENISNSLEIDIEKNNYNARNAEIYNFGI